MVSGRFAPGRCESVISICDPVIGIIEIIVNRVFPKTIYEILVGLSFTTKNLIS